MQSISGKSSHHDVPTRAKPTKVRQLPPKPPKIDHVTQQNIRTVEKEYNALIAHPDFAAKVASLPSLGADGEKKLDALCAKLNVPDESRGDFKAAARKAFSWLDPKSLSQPEQDAVLRLDKEWKDAMAAAHPDNSKLKQFLHVLPAGLFLGFIGYSAVTFASHLATALAGPAGLRALYVGGPLLLLLTGPVGGSYRAGGGHYAGVDYGAFTTHDKLEREFKEIEWEAWFVAKKEAKAAPGADKAGWKHRLDGLAKQGDLVRISQQRNFVDMLRRELGHKLGAKASTDNRDATSMIRCCCSKVEAEIDAEGNAKVLYDGTELFTLVDPASFKTFKQGGSAGVIWPKDGSMTDLNSDKVPAEFENVFLKAQASMAMGATLRAMITDELMFLPLCATIAISAPMGIWSTHHPELVTAPTYMDMLLSMACSTLGMGMTALAQNVARSYMSGANVITKRDELIQEKLHALCDAKEDLLDERLARVDDLAGLVAAELKHTRRQFADVDKAMVDRTTKLCSQHGITREQLVAYGAARRKAKAEGVEFDAGKFPEISKVRDAVDVDDELHDLIRSGKPSVIAEKLIHLERLKGGLADQKRALVNARDVQTHDRHAAGKSPISFRTAIADAYKAMGRSAANTAMRTLSYSVAFVFYCEVFLMKGVSSLLPATSPPPFNGTDFMSNVTTPGVIDDHALVPAMTLAMGAGLLILMPFLSQRDKAFLWPLQKIVHDGYGIAKGVKAYVWDAPPKVPEKMAEAVIADNRRKEDDDSVGSSSDLDIGSRQIEGAGSNLLDDLAESLHDETEKKADRRFDEVVVIPMGLHSDPLPVLTPLHTAHAAWLEHIEELGGSLIMDPGALLSNEGYEAVAEILEEAAESGDVQTAVSAWVDQHPDQAGELERAIGMMNLRQCSSIFGLEKGSIVFDAMQSMRVQKQ